MANRRGGTHLIADIAKVSRGTVDRALHGRGGINEETRERILQIARQIGYKPNLAARALSANRASATIGVCIPREIHFFYDQLWSGILEEAERVSQFGVEFINRPIRNLGEGDTEAFRDLMASGVDGIILTAGNPRKLKPLINKAESKGIRVVCVDTDASESRRSSVVYVEPYLSGCVAGELLGKLVPSGSKVAVMAGMLKAEDHRRKAEGFSRTFPKHCEGGQIAAVIEGHEDEEESFHKTLDLLQRIPGLAGIYVNTVNCLPVCRALETAEIRGKSEADHNRPFSGNVILLPERHNRCIHLPSAAPARTNGGPCHDGQPDLENQLSSYGASQPGGRDVVESAPVPGDARRRVNTCRCAREWSAGNERDESTTQSTSEQLSRHFFDLLHSPMRILPA